MSINPNWIFSPRNSKIAHYLTAALSMSRVLSMVMKPQQCIAARDLLQITPEILAGYAGVSVETILAFEERAPKISQSIVESIQVALEYAGVEFLEASNSDRRLVRLRSHFTPFSAYSIEHDPEIDIRRQKNEICD